MSIALLPLNKACMAANIKEQQQKSRVLLIFFNTISLSTILFISNCADKCALKMGSFNLTQIS